MNRDVVHTPGPATPRMRPGGPRTLTRRGQAQSYKPFPSTELSDESAPAYNSGHNSPSTSSRDGSSSSASPSVATFPVGQLIAASDVLYEEPAQVGVRGSREQATQTDGVTPTPTRVSTPVVRIVVKQPTLTPPAAVSFESEPVPWRGLTMESAQWTLTSVQLQEIVSRAIRKTASESFIRLLSVKTLDEELTAELERLDTLKVTTQAQYRFNTYRRTMLLQSLLALGTGAGDHDPAALYSLTTQLADVTAACDRLMAELLRVADQKAQIAHLMDVHETSALAMALRKLNASYAKRTSELREARQTNTQLKRELEEAWAVAREMAEEMDALDEFETGFSSDEGHVDGEDTNRLDDSVRLAQVIGITGRAVATKAMLTSMESQDTGSATAQNGNMRGKEREPQIDRAQWVEKAKKRSSIASKASLRLPKSSKSSVADTRSISSRLSKKKSLRRMSFDPKRASSSAQPPSSIPLPAPVPTPPPAPPMLELNMQEVHNVRKRKDSSFLELAETRQVSPITPTKGSAPPVPILGDIASHLETRLRPPRSDTQAHQSLSQQSSLDFSLPPYDTSIDNSSGSLLPVGTETRTRRVQSVLVGSGRKSLDDSGREESNGGSDIKRSASDYRKSDAWTFGRGTSVSGRRQSMPFSGMGSSSSLPRLPIGPASSSDSINSAHRSNGQSRSADRPMSPNSRTRSPVPRVFSPPPAKNSSSSPVSTKSAHGIPTDTVPPRVFSPPPRAFSPHPSTASPSSSSSLSGFTDPVTPSPIRVFSPKSRLTALAPTHEAIEEADAPLETPKIASPPPYAASHPASTLTPATSRDDAENYPLQPPRVFPPRPPLPALP